MTHVSRRRFHGFGPVLAGLAAAALVATAAPAMAGVPSPTPSPTQFGGDHHKLRLLPEQFDGTITNLDPAGDVEAFGPVAMHLGTDSSSVFRDVFSDGLGDTVNVDRAELPLPVVDLRTCSLVFTQLDAPWNFDGGTGIWTAATGSGVFDLTGLVSYREIIKKRWDWDRPRVRCPLAGVSPFFARWSVEHNGRGLPRPVIYEFGFQATGLAAVPRVRVPEPCPTQINHFAPTASPSLTRWTGGEPTCAPTAAAA